MVDDNDYDIVENMERYGGSFVKALSVCFWKADASNYKRLREAFPDYWKKYTNFNKKIC